MPSRELPMSPQRLTRVVPWLDSQGSTQTASPQGKFATVFRSLTQSRSLSTLVCAGLLAATATSIAPTLTLAQPTGRIKVIAPAGPVPASINRDRLNALLDQAAAAIKAQRYGDAAAAYQEAIPMERDNARLYSGLGYAQSKRGDFKASAEAFRLAVSLEQNNADFHNGLGYALANLQDYKAASQAYRRAIQSDSKKVEAYIGLGTVLRRDQQFDSAIAVYEQYKALKPRDWRSYEAIGTMQIQKRQYSKALQQLQKAEQYAPSNATIQVSKAVALLGLNRPSEGVAALERASFIESKNPTIFLKLGEVYQTLGQDDKAFNAYRKAVSLRPDFNEAHSRIAKMHMAQREYAQAMVIYQEILKRAPRDADAYYNLALALRARDRNKEAKEALQRAERIFKEEGNRERLDETKKLLRELR